MCKWHNRLKHTFGKPLLTALWLGFASAAVFPSWAQALQQSPVEVIRERNGTLERILGPDDEEVSEANRERLKDVLNDLVDFWELSRRSLGRHWEDLSDQQKSDFVEVFEALIRNSSVRKLSMYRADTIEYVASDQSADRAVVTTTARKDRKEVEIIYHMHRADGEWRIYDMVIDGASTVRNYRDSFYREIARSSYEQMYERLVRRLDEEETPPAR
jgi:phospholipid transport system substrate-binding protein